MQKTPLKNAKKPQKKDSSAVIWPPNKMERKVFADTLDPALPHVTSSDLATMMKQKAHYDLFVDREESWLAFNSRVLSEAEDKRNPLLERVKFLAIFSTNLDEFFMVRVAGILTQVAQNVCEEKWVSVVLLGFGAVLMLILSIGATTCIGWSWSWEWIAPHQQHCRPVAIEAVEYLVDSSASRTGASSNFHCRLSRAFGLSLLLRRKFVLTLFKRHRSKLESICFSSVSFFPCWLRWWLILRTPFLSLGLKAFCFLLFIPWLIFGKAICRWTLRSFWGEKAEDRLKSILRDWRFLKVEESLCVNGFY